MTNTEMTHNGIKKELYKKNPKATFMGATKDHLTYNCLLGIFDEKPVILWFEIPFTDIGDAKFYSEMDSKLLIRWLVVYGTENEPQ